MQREGDPAVAEVGRDETERHLLRQSAVVAGIARIFRVALTSETEEELGRACLAVAEEVTASRFGFIAEINPATNRLDDIAVSNPGWDACAMREKDGHGYKVPVALEIHGIHGRVLLDGRTVIANDPATHPDRVGTPPGHPRIESFLGVPLVEAGRTIGMLALGNREGGYGPEEAEAVELLAPAIVQAFQRKRAEAALRQANARLVEADRRKDEFLGMLSHELRNPLAPIQNSLYVLDNAEPAGQQARRAREVMKRQVAHLTRLVDDLLDVTRIARGKIQLRIAEIDLAELVRRTGEDHRALMQRRGIHFAVEISGAPLRVRGDETRLAQIVGNLLHNAAKFTPAAGRVTLSAAAAGTEAEIRVRDTGAGIDPALLSRIFEPFTQGEQTLARSEGGLGLGLALVKGLVELHHGVVSASSDGRGRGAELTVRIPLLARASAPSPGSARPPGPAGARRRVLVVDDDRDAAESLAEVVRILGHAADVALDGAAAVEAARRTGVDVVLCDIGLPGMTGYDVARAIRAQGPSGIRLVAVSGYAQPDDLRAAADAGFDLHVAKPVDPGAIARLLSGEE